VMDGPPGLARYSLLLLERAGGQERPALPHGAEMRDERGLCVYGTSLDEARELAARDPAVQAGRLVADVLTWWTQPGLLPSS
jgi:hypothetical protein